MNCNCLKIANSFPCMFPFEERIVHFGLTLVYILTTLKILSHYCWDSEKGNFKLGIERKVKNRAGLTIFFKECLSYIKKVEET